jgi:rubrerythrin
VGKRTEPSLGTLGGENALNVEAAPAPLSRRHFLTGSAAILAGGALLATPGVAKAHNPSSATDIDMLNFALTLEHLEATFYTQGLKKFSQREIERLNIFDDFGQMIRNRIYANLTLIRDHENEHVDTLTKVIKLLGGTPVPPAKYDFGAAFEIPREFIAVAQLLENTGVTAYDGAVAHIEAGAVITGGAQIATVEARHASYLNLLNGDNGNEPDEGVPFPDAFDQPVAPRAVFDAAAAFITTPLTAAYPPYGSLGAFRNRLPNFVVGLDGVVPIPPEGL